MFNDLYKFKELLQTNSTIISNSRLNKIVKDYSIYQIYQEIEFDDTSIIYQNFIDSKIVIINHFIDENENEKSFSISFKKTIIIIIQSSLFLLHSLFTNNKEIKVYFMPGTQEYFNQYIKIDSSQNIIKYDYFFNEEISNFNKSLNLIPQLQPLIGKIWKIIKPCISIYLIKTSHEKCNQNKLKKFPEYLKKEGTECKREVWNEREYILLRNICNTSSSRVKLIYYIEKEEIFVIKIPNKNLNKSNLTERECENYSQLDYPLLPKFIGTVKKENYLIIEFINGRTLENIHECQLDDCDKVTIILEIILIFLYLHNRNFVYRDLKPNNVMIDQNKTAVLIDFDQMIKEPTDGEHTADFASNYIAPEIGEGRVSLKSDIYSIGKMIKYIFTENNVNTKIDPKIEKLYEVCTNINYDKRPSIDKLYNFFLSNYNSKIKSSLLENNPEISTDIGLLYFYGQQKDVKKAIYYFTLASNHNYGKALHMLGFIYITGEYVPIDINKSINYFTLAGKQNYSDSIYSLGVIYHNGINVIQNINKAISYYSFASDLNNHNAQYNLGVIYEQGVLVPRDIDKAIFYYSLSADQNDARALYNLGVLYENGKYVSQDIHKAINYYSLASNQNHTKSQFKLGKIFSNGKLTSQNIQKAIHYYSLAAANNDPDAQNILGSIYFSNECGLLDIKKAIYYFSLAADQNKAEAQNDLGVIFLKKDYGLQDINKAIHYYSLAADQNFSISQNNLGEIYSSKEYGFLDIQKAIHYFSLSADQKYDRAQYNLGCIYLLKEYGMQDINKSIHYFLLAADQNHMNAQIRLGIIYYNNEYVPKNIKKAIHYFTLAANQNDKYSQFNLGNIYYNNKDVPRDINKSIKYYTLAANQNLAKAQSKLGEIYHLGYYVKQDISKAMHYYLLAAEQNDAISQNNLGVIYFDGKYIPTNINKAIYYYSLAANQNYEIAQINLAAIYQTNDFGLFDIQKAIHYYSLALNNVKARYFLGLLYYEGNKVSRDINKAVYYFTLASNQNHGEAQFYLAEIYFKGEYVEKSIKKGILYFSLSAKNGIKSSFHILGFLYHQGNFVEQDINQSIRYYKEASSFNIQYAKNNLGIIYKHGFDDKVTKNIGLAIEYFQEAIYQNNDTASMYNLAHLYLYEVPTNENFDKSIELLIKSSNLQFQPSLTLLCLSLNKKFGFNIPNIKNKLAKYKTKSEKLFPIISKMLFGLQKMYFNARRKINEYYEKIDFLYNYDFNIILTKSISKKCQDHNQSIKNISSLFYEGFNLP